MVGIQLGGDGGAFGDIIDGADSQMIAVRFPMLVETAENFALQYAPMSHVRSTRTGQVI